MPTQDWLFLLWVLVQPPENGGYGMSWPEAVRMGPTQALFVMQTREQAERGAIRRNRRVNGLDAKTHAEMLREAMKAARKRFTGKETRQELSEPKAAKRRK